MNLIVAVLMLASAILGLLYEKTNARLTGDKVKLGEITEKEGAQKQKTYRLCVRLMLLISVGLLLAQIL